MQKEELCGYLNNLLSLIANIASMALLSLTIAIVFTTFYEVVNALGKYYTCKHPDLDTTAYVVLAAVELAIRPVDALRLMTLSVVSYFVFKGSAKGKPGTIYEKPLLLLMLGYFPFLVVQYFLGFLDIYLQNHVLGVHKFLPFVLNSKKGNSDNLSWGTQLPNALLVVVEFSFYGFVFMKIRL